MEIRTSSDRVLNSLTYFLKSDTYLSGDVSGNEFAFMHIDGLSKFHPYSLVIFSGDINENNSLSTLNIKARLTKPFSYFYLFAALITPIVYLTVPQFHKAFQYVPYILVNPLFAPAWIYLLLLGLYLMKIKDAKIVLSRFKHTLENS